MFEPGTKCSSLPLLLCFGFFLAGWFWMKCEIYERKVDTRDELLAGTLDAAASTKKHEDQLRRKTRDLRTRLAKCFEFDGGIFGHLL
jgi:hypothetical protein